MMRGKMKFPQYTGMSYEQASREAARLIKLAHENGRWFHIVEKLAVLKRTMELVPPCQQFSELHLMGRKPQVTKILRQIRSHGS